LIGGEKVCRSWSDAGLFSEHGDFFHVDNTPVGVVAIRRKLVLCWTDGTRPAFVVTDVDKCRFDSSFGNQVLKKFVVPP
jgi:hypothetical protein